MLLLLLGTTRWTRSMNVLVSSLIKLREMRQTPPIVPIVPPIILLVTLSRAIGTITFVPIRITLYPLPFLLQTLQSPLQLFNNATFALQLLIPPIQPLQPIAQTRQLSLQRLRPSLLLPLLLIPIRSHFLGLSTHRHPLLLNLRTLLLQSRQSCLDIRKERTDLSRCCRSLLHGLLQRKHLLLRPMFTRGLSVRCASKNLDLRPQRRVRLL